MKSPIPATIESTIPSSPSLPMSPTTTDIIRNRPASSGKYQSSVMGTRLSLKSPQGITEKIMSKKVKPKIHSTAFCRPLILGGSASSAARPSSSGNGFISDLLGSFRTFLAYRSTNHIETGTKIRYIKTRRTMPSPSGTLAPADATPVAKGLTVDAKVPVPAPSKMTVAPTIRSYFSATKIGTINA